jgi:hypothetical protein
MFDNMFWCCYYVQHEAKAAAKRAPRHSRRRFRRNGGGGLPSPPAGSLHRFKYRLALVVNGNCVLRFDNEAGKGDHKHIGQKEFPYVFTTPQALLDDFWNEVNQWRF